MNYQVETQGAYHVVTCSADLDPTGCVELIPILKGLAEKIESSTSPDIVLDLLGKAILDVAFFKEAKDVLLLMRSRKKQLLVLRAPIGTEQFVRKAGMDSLIRVMKEIPGLQKKSAPKIDVAFINPFIQGAMDTLRIQCQFEAKPAKPYLKKPDEELNVDIAAVIGLASKTFSGSIALCFPANIFLKLMENMLGEKYEKITHELEDGAGELLNIIFGQAKKSLNENGYQIEKAIPSVVTGNNLKVTHISPGAAVILPFDTSLGKFYIEVSMEAYSL